MRAVLQTTGMLALAALAFLGCQSQGGHDNAATIAPPAAEPVRASVVFAETESPFGGAYSRISVYGERVDQSLGAGGFGDGASNMDQITFASEGQVFDPDADAAGQWLVFASTQHRMTADIYLKSATGSTLTQLTNDPADDMMPEFSPDGRWIAFASNRSGSFDVYIMPRDGGQPQLVAGDACDEVHPSWSPDGRRLVYSRFADQSRRWEIWVVEVANPTTHHFIDYGFLPEWCPDPAQSKIVFQRARERGSRFHSIWTIDLIDGQGRNPTEIISAANAALINPGWSADGRRIVFASVVNPDDGSGFVPEQSELWIVNLDGTGRSNLAGGAAANFQPTWGSGRRIYFVSNRGGNDNIWAVSATVQDDPAALATAPNDE